MNKIEERLQRVAVESDLGCNVHKLHDVASQALDYDVLVDLGVRGGVSSITMLDATEEQKCRVIGVDPIPCVFPIPARYTYLQTDSVTASSMISGPLFMVFFDTLHIKEQVMAELFHFWPKIRVGGYAAFHDTEWPVDRFEFHLGKSWAQAVDGVNAFFADAGTHIERVHYPESFGMTFIKKLDDWNPTVNGMDEALSVAACL